MMEYFHYKKAKAHQDVAEKSEAPVLTEEDEAFFNSITNEGTPPPLPSRPLDLATAGETEGNDAQLALVETPPPLPERPQSLAVDGLPRGRDAQMALMNGAQDIPLPDVPDTPDGVLVGIEGEELSKGKEKGHEAKKPFKWSFLRRDSRDSKRKMKATAATDLHSVAEGLKAADAQPNEDGEVSTAEARKEEEEMTVVLDQLNLAAVNNRVFSISKESQDLLHK